MSTRFAPLDNHTTINPFAALFTAPSNVSADRAVHVSADVQAWAYLDNADLTSNPTRALLLYTQATPEQVATPAAARAWWLRKTGNTNIDPEYTYQLAAGKLTNGLTGYQIASIVQQLAAGTTWANITAELGVSRATISTVSQYIGHVQAADERELNDMRTAASIGRTYAQYLAGKQLARTRRRTELWADMLAALEEVPAA